MTSIDSIINSYCEMLSNRCEIVDLLQIFTDLDKNEKVTFSYHLLKSDNFLPQFEIVSGKSVAVALQYRNLGNKAFYRKGDADALKYYTKSVAASPIDSEELALAYANRSAVLFKLKKYNSSLLDINRALEKNYPDFLKQKLYDRKKNCLINIKMENMCESINLNYFSNISLNDDSINRMENYQLDVEYNEVNNGEKFQLPYINFDNEAIPNASSKIKINFTDEMGRHLVATQNIEPGEILAIEKPYASILLPEFSYSHCSYCFVRCECLIPCNSCSLVMFCGKHCREKAFKLFHRTECEILALVRSLEFSKMELLSLRILIIASNQGKELKSLMVHPLYSYPIMDKYINVYDKFISEDYFSVHNLEDNFSKRSVQNSFSRSVVAAVLLHVLKQSSFFSTLKRRERKNLSSKLTKIESFAGSLLLKYLFSVSSNAHEISELIEENTFKQIKTESIEIGAALYPLLSLTNHSCDPNVVRHSHKDYIVFRSIQPITAGEQLFDNYGYHYAIHTLQERQDHLKIQYFFQCCCKPCQFNWPVHENLPLTDPEYIDDTVDTKKIKEYSTIFRNTLKQPLNFKTNDQLNFSCEYLLLLHKSIKRPWKEYNECQEVIKRIMASRANYYSFATDIIY